MSLGVRVSAGVEPGFYHLEIFIYYGRFDLVRREPVLHCRGAQTWLARTTAAEQMVTQVLLWPAAPRSTARAHRAQRRRLLAHKQSRKGLTTGQTIDTAQNALCDS